MVGGEEENHLGTMNSSQKRKDKDVLALQDCNRLTISEPYPEWNSEIMPSRYNAWWDHSTSVLLQSGKIWIAGSNTHDTCRDQDKYPTETRIEAFFPPYLDEAFNIYRPQINEDASQKELSYGNIFETEFSVEDGAGFTANDIKDQLLGQRDLSYLEVTVRNNHTRSIQTYMHREKETEQQFHLWWYVDSMPIRVFQNYENEGIAIPTSKE
ncbi:aldehyde oxidase GLOX1 [Trifolium repens]|nr:aldehyde oxidase GLOX1 [Trifolium repens]